MVPDEFVFPRPHGHARENVAAIRAWHRRVIEAIDAQSAALGLSDRAALEFVQRRLPHTQPTNPEAELASLLIWRGQFEDYIADLWDMFDMPLGPRELGRLGKLLGHWPGVCGWCFNPEHTFEECPLTEEIRSHWPEFPFGDE